ncbi:Nuclear transport factor 2 [Quaeritorhiza haematococci]|nr:Nuclear transport factor 2 [Quaeritorhiza haematococci]
MADMNAINNIAKSFVDFYYSTFDANRSNLRPVYKDVSMLSFEGQHTQGVEAIIQKLVGLPFQRVQHRVATIDAQPANPQLGSIMVMVTGQLLVDEEQNPQHFSQTFQLVPEGPSNYFVYNDVFRLNYGF